MNEMLGKYHLLHKIGEGGMAEVFLAITDNTPYALKLLKPDRSLQKDAVDNFIKEVHIGSKLDHPNVLKVIDHGKIDENYFSVMELVLGLSVMDLINHFAKMCCKVPLSLALYMICETCQILKYIHSSSVFKYSNSTLFHGDISPQNLMLTQEGMLKLMDFGSAGQTSNLDESRQYFGKLAYLPADILSGGKMDRSTDIYGLAVIAFYLLFNRLPFKSKNSNELCQIIKEGDVPKLDAQHIVKTSRDENSLRLFFNKALNKQAALRFSNIDEFEKEFFRLKFSQSPLTDITTINSYYPDSFSKELEDLDREWNVQISQFKKKNSQLPESELKIEIESLLAHANRRRHPRILTLASKINAAILDTENKSKIELPIHELSRGGMLLKWPDLSPSVGTLYPVEIRLGNEYRPIRAIARLLYNKTKRRQYFAGFQFMNISTTSMHLLDRFVQSQIDEIKLDPSKVDEASKRIFLDVYFKDRLSFREEFERNMRHGGMYTECSEDVNDGTDVFIRIHLPLTFRRILLKGKVVFVKSDTHNKKSVALQLDIKPEQIRHIQKLL